MADFENKTGFRPYGNALKFWTLLPQVTSNAANNPPLFGKIKGIGIYYAMVIILLALEGYLAYALNEEGLDFIMFVALSVADFVIVILPALIHLSPGFNPAIINANIFIHQTKLKIDNKPDDNFKNNTENYTVELRKELANYKSQRTKNNIVGLAVFFVILVLSGMKVNSFYGILGNDIFVEAIGRYILIGIVISILVHTFCTKVVFYHFCYNLAFSKQRKEFEEYGDHKISKDETNKPYSLNYNVPYTPVATNNQRICQELPKNVKDQLMEGSFSSVFLSYDNRDIEYRVDKIEETGFAKLVYSGLLLDSELTSLSIQQQDNAARTAVIASGKEIQLSQIVS